MNLNIKDIEIGIRKRNLNKNKVQSLAESFKSIGQLQPVTVFSETDKYHLIAGLHRLEAAKLLGWQSIEAIQFEGNEIEIELAEIDENLMRNDLTVLEQGEFLARRQELIGFKRGGDRRSDTFQSDTVSLRKSQEEIAKEIGLTERSAQRRMQAAHNIIPELKDAIRDTEIANSTTQLLGLSKLEPEKQIKIIKPIVEGKAKNINEAIREMKREEIISHLEEIKRQEAIQPTGLYDTIIIDPPWPMTKIERDERPNQSEFDYPVMSVEEVAEIKLPMADDCHVFLWTTQKYLPAAFEIFKAWGIKYVYTHVWHKKGGFQPYELPQYNCEFCLYGRKGSPKFIDTKNFFTCFEAPRGKHSEKPEEFYEMLRRVTGGRRLDMFNRRKIYGFDGHGNEAKLASR